MDINEIFQIFVLLFQLEEDLPILWLIVSPYWAYILLFLLPLDENYVLLCFCVEVGHSSCYFLRELVCIHKSSFGEVWMFNAKGNAYKIYNYNTNKTKNNNTRRIILPTNSITKNPNNTLHASDIQIINSK